MMDNSDNSILSIRSIPLDADPKELVDLFGIAGPITQAHITRHPQTLQSLGYGFVKYADPKDAKRALNLNGKMMRKSTLMVTMHSAAASNPPLPAEPAPTPLMPTPPQQQVPLLNDPAPPGNNSSSYSLLTPIDPSHPMNPIESRPPIITNPPGFVPAKVFLENIPVTMKELEIRAQFGKFGQILEVKILLDGAGLSKGIGFIKFESLEAAAKAATEMNGMRVENGFKPLVCKLSASKEHSDASKAGQRKSRFSDNPEAVQTARIARFGPTPMSGIQRTVSLTASPGATSNRFEPYAKPQGQNSFLQGSQGQGQYQSQNPNPYQNNVPQGFNSAAPTGQGYGASQGYGQVQNPGYNQVAQGYQQGQGYDQSQGYNQSQGYQQGQGYQQSQESYPGQQQTGGPKSIYVGNLPETSCKNCLLYNLFAPYGAVESVKGLEGKDSEHKTWFGFVNYVDYGAAERAVSMLDKSSLDGSNLKVQIKNDRPREQRGLRPFVKRPYNGIHSKDPK